MATKKKKDVEEKLVEEPVKEPKKKLPALCGHVNMHALDPKGMLAKPECDLLEGHDGDHHGLVKQRQEVEKIYDKIYGKHIDTKYEIVEVDTFWNDAAGVLARDIKPEAPPSRNKKGEFQQAINELMA